MPPSHIRSPDPICQSVKIPAAQVLAAPQQGKHVPLWPQPPDEALVGLYAGDVLENGETHAELLGLPNHTVPVTMLCFGRSPKPIEPRPRYAKRMLHKNAYQRMSEADAREMNEDLARLWAPHGLKPGIENYGQDVYRRKFTSEFMLEMNRSVAWWIERWQTPEA